MDKETQLISVLVEMLQRFAPELHIIAAHNQKYLKDMEYGEIHITEYVRNGQIVRVETSPKISVAIPTEE